MAPQVHRHLALAHQFGNCFPRAVCRPVISYMQPDVDVHLRQDTLQ